MDVTDSSAHQRTHGGAHRAGLIAGLQVIDAAGYRRIFAGR